MESEDTHPDKLLDLWEWLVEYRTQVILGIVIALGGGMYWYINKIESAKAEETAADELLAASNPAFTIDGANTNLAVSGQLKKVAEENPGTAAAVNASFLSASALFDERSYADAEGAFQDFVSRNKNSPLAASARFGMAASREAAKPSEVAKAITGYQAVVAQFPRSPEALQARVAMAKLYLRQEKPDPAKAKELLDQVTGDGQVVLIPVFWRGEAMRLAASLEPKGEPESKPEPKPEPNPEPNPEPKPEPKPKAKEKK